MNHIETFSISISVQPSLHGPFMDLKLHGPISASMGAKSKSEQIDSFNQGMLAWPSNQDREPCQSLSRFSFSALASADLNYLMLLSPLNKDSHCPGLYLYFKALSHPPPRAGTIHMLPWKRASQGFLLRFGLVPKAVFIKVLLSAEDVTATACLHLTQDSQAKWCPPLFA